MDQINARVDCDVSRLDFPLRPFKARAWHNFVVLFRRVPADATGLFVRIFRDNGAYFDVTGHEHPDGGWTVRIPAACFPNVGEFSYEVHATASDDQPAAIGEGRLVVDAFSSGAPPTEGEVRQVSELPIEGGGTVQVVMVYEDGAWKMRAVTE